jgi:type III pantothenate kinase
MIILVDIGNSNIVLTKYINGFETTYRYNTDKSKSIDEYYVLLQHIITDAKGMIVSSVVPELNIIFKNLALKYLQINPTFVGPGIKTGIKVMIDNPKELGTDIVSDAVGATHYYDTVDAIVVDMGTATTISTIENKIIKGVSICAGLVTQRNALVGKASQLSQFEFRIPKNAIGTNTIDSLNSGLLLGHKYMIEGLVEEIKQKHPGNPKVLITGGASRFMQGILRKDYIFDEDLLVKGLYQIYKKNI